MRVFCPNCSEPITIADDLAGKTTTCPLCQAAFTAPPLFSSSPVAAPSPSTTSPLADSGNSPTPPVSSLPSPVPEPVSEPLPEPPSSPLPPPSPAPIAASPTLPPLPVSKLPEPERLQITPSEASGRLEHRISFSIPPEVFQWAAPVCLGVCIFLTFFSWNGAYPGGHAVYTQGPWRALVGSFSADAVGEKVLRLNPRNPSEGQFQLESQVGYDLLMLLYLPLLFLSFALAVFFALLPTLPVRIPPNFVNLLPWRMLIIVGLGVLLTIILMIQAIRGFSLENALYRYAREDAAKVVTHQFAPSNPETEQDIKIREIVEGMEIGQLNVGQTTALSLVFILQVVAIVGATAAFLIAKRIDKPMPRVELQW